VPRKPAADVTMADRIASAIAKADGAELHTDPVRYRHFALAALKPLTQPSEAMIDAAHEAAWFDNFWAINSRRDRAAASRARACRA
jgi:hypothetical protein